MNQTRKEIIETTEPKVCVKMAAGSGKAQPNDTLIPTPTGYRTIGSLQPGDYVFNRHGKPTKVLEVYPQGEKEIWVVKFLDKREVKCCSEHLWTVYDRASGEYITKTTAELQNMRTTYLDENERPRFRFYAPTLMEAAEFEEKELEVEPETIGEEVVNGLIDDIPQEYLTASPAQREALFNTIMGVTDEKIEKKSPVIFTTDNYDLACQVSELCRSLGYSNHVTLRGEEYQYQVRTRVGVHRDSVGIGKIRATDDTTEMTCILVEDEEHLYITNDYIITHNTFILTERAKHLLNQGEDDIVVLTFTNAAAAEMKKRIEGAQIPLKNTFIGTIHSYINYLLLSSGVSTGALLNEENFDELFDCLEEHLNCVRPISHLLLDEAQDSTRQQFHVILDLLKPQNFFFVFDLRQSIFSFSNADPDFLMGLMREDDVVTYTQNENFRNGNNILNFAKGLINQLGYQFYDTSIPTVEGGEVFKIEFTPENVRNVILEDRESKFRDWFILVRTNRELNYFYDSLKSYGIPCDTFKKSELDNNSLEAKMNENTVKILTIHTSKGLENKNVIVGSFPMYGPEEIRVGYVAATRAKDKLYWFKPKQKKKTKIQIWE